MPHEKFSDGKPPRFFKEPSPEDIEQHGQAMANIHARVRARIIGSRVLASAVVLGTGTAITAQELLTDQTTGPVGVLANYGIPAIINGLAEIKVERQLRITEKEISAILSPDTDT